MSTFALVLDGIIRKTKDESVNIAGMHLYNALASVGRLAVLCGEDEERADWFLKTNGLTRHGALLPERPSSGSTKESRRLAQVSELRSHGGHVEFVVESDPELATAIFKQGIPVMLYSHPRFTLPSFRPDYRSTARPWDDLTKEIDYQERLRVEQANRKDDDE